MEQMNSTSSVFVLSAILLISGSQAICQTIPAAPVQAPAPSAAATNWSRLQTGEGSAELGKPSPSSDQNETAANPASPGRSSSQDAPLKLSLHDAEQMAIKNHPRITIAALSALASREAARQVKAAFYPTISVNATGVTTFRDGNRITAGALNNPSVFDRAASGATASQLITDFGRTRNFSSAADLHAQATEQNAVATREQIVFTVDQTFYNALSTDVLVKVAEQTVRSRQVLVDQVQALEKAKLRSALDLSFANVNLAQAQLLLVDAKSNRDAAYANLAEALGLPGEKPIELVDLQAPQPLAGTVDQVIQMALANRPDVKAFELEQSSAEHLMTAEERLQLPDISALGTTGITPVASNRLGTNTYGAVGVNVHIPVFNGFLFSSRAAEAKYRARAAAESVRDIKDTVARQVRVAYLNVNSTFERENVAAKLLDQATLSLNLAQARYNLGLSSIVELSQAQLQQTEAEISTVTAKYQYELAVAALSYQAGQ
jgi:outer membrane protein